MRKNANGRTTRTRFDARAFVGAALLMLVVFAGCDAGAGPDVFLPASAPPPAFEGERLTYLHDPRGEFDVQDLQRRRSEFRPAPGTPPRLGRVSGATWFRLQLSQPANGQRSLLEIAAFSAERVQVFQDGRKIFSGGINAAFTSRPIPHRNLLIPVDFATAPGVVNADDAAKAASGGASESGDSSVGSGAGPGQARSTNPTELFIRIETRATTELPLRVWNPADFFAAALIEYYLLGVFLGGVLLMSAYNAFLWLSVREPGYFYYACYSLAMAYFATDQDGTFTHLFQTGEGYRPWSFLIGNAILTSSAALFVDSYLAVRRHFPPLHRTLRIFAAVAATSFVPGCFGLPYGVLLNTVNAIALVLIALTIVAVILSMRRGLPEARVLSVALLPVAAIAAYRMLWLAGFAPYSDVLFKHGIKTAILAELLILSFGLAGRYNRLKALHARTILRTAEERRQLTGEVHDNIGSQIGAALLHLRDGGDPLRARSVLESALRTVRDFASLLRAGDDEQNRRPLSEEFKAFAKTYAGVRGLKLDTHVDPACDELPLRTSVLLLRVLQEWCSNCMRHGGARRFQIELRSGRRVRLRIRSDGRAFAWDGRPRPGDSGLRGISERAAALGGRARAFAGSSNESSGETPTGVSTERSGGSLLILVLPAPGTDFSPWTRPRKSPVTNPARRGQNAR